MIKWEQYEITNNFDNSVIMISWDGITIHDARTEVKMLAEKLNKEITDFTIIKTR